MDTNQNNSNPFNSTPSSPLSSAPGNTPSQGFDLSQTSSANPTPLASSASTQMPSLTPEANFTPSLNTPIDSGGVGFPSKSPWDSSSTSAPIANSTTSVANPTDLSSISTASSPSPLSLPSDLPTSSTPPITNTNSAPVDFNSLSSGSSISQPTPLTASSTGGGSSAPASTSWSPQSIDSTQSVPVNPQSNQPMTDSSMAPASLPSGLNLSDQTSNSLMNNMNSQTTPAMPSLTPDTSAMSTSSSAPTDLNSSFSSSNMPTGGSDGTSSTSSWPTTPPTDPASASMPSTPPVDSSVMSSSSAGSNPFGVEAAPTDLSHLVDNSLPTVGTPNATVAGSGPSQFEPTSSNQTVSPVTSTNQPTASISGEGGGPGLPKAIIFLVIGVLLIVAAALAYIFLGVGKMSPPSTSVPIDQHLTTPPTIPTTAVVPTGSSSGSSVLTITPAPTSSSSASGSGSAVDLLRGNK